MKLYRAVGPDELEDMQATGVLRPDPNGKSLEGKWFAESLNHARQWGAMLKGVGHFTLIEAVFQDELASDFFWTVRLDTVGPARYVEAKQLQSATWRILQRTDKRMDRK